MRTTLPARVLYRPGVVRRRDGARSSRGCGSRAGRVDDIAARGAFIRRDVAGASVLIVGDGDGRRAPSTTSAAIAARGCAMPRPAARLPAASSVRITRWTYGLDGRLIGAPQMDEVEGFDARGLSAPRASRATSGTATSSSTSRRSAAAARGTARRTARRASRRGG